MSSAAISSEDSAPVSAATVALLEELARLPAVQKGEFEAVAELVCRRCLELVDARYVSVWMLDADRKFLRSIVRHDGLTRRPCPEIAIPIAHIIDELAALHISPQIVSDNALADPRLTGTRDSYFQEYEITGQLEHVIRASGEDIGIFSIERVGPPRAWHSTDSALARGVCSYLALTSVNRQKSALEQRSASTTALQTAILNNAAYAVIATDLKGTITFFNRAAEQMLGYRADDVVNKTSPALFHDATEVAYRATLLTTQLNREIEPGFCVFVAKTLAGLPNEDEWTYVRRDGSRMTALVSITAIRAANGEVEGFLGIASDVTERNEIAHRLSQSEEMLSRVLLQSPDAILITALADGRILEVNPGFEQITGYARAEAVGHTTIDLSLWVDLAERNAMIQQVRESGEVKSMPIQISRRGGDRRQCILWGRTFEYAGVPALLTSVQDVTDIKEAEQVARMAQAMLQAVLDTVPAHVFWKDSNSVYMGCNRQFAIDNGFSSPADIVGTTDYDQLRQITPEYLAEIARVQESDRHIIATKEASTPRHIPFVMPDDSLHWMSVTKRPLLDENGNAFGILGVQHDITDMLESERRAKNAQHMLQQVLDTIPSFVFWKDRNFAYLGCNRHFGTEAGLSDPSQIIGKTDYELPWSAHAEAFVTEDREVLTSGNALVDLMKPFQSADGSIRWIRTDKLPMADATGSIVGILGVQHDVTEQLRSQEQLRASEEKLRSLYALSPLGINLQDMDGRYLEANDAFLAIVGYDRDEIKRLTCYDLIAKEFLDGEPERLRLLEETGLIPAYEKAYRRKDGSLVAVSTSTVRVSGPDGASFKWTIVEDITERRLVQAAQKRLNEDLERLVGERTVELQVAMQGLMRAEKLASLGSLVAGVAHEISTPVGNASLATSTLVGAVGDFERELAGKLSRAALDGFVKQIKLGVDIANRNIERVAGLIQSFKQVAVDQTSSQRRRFHLTEVVDEIVTTMHPSLKRSGVTTDISIPADLVLDSYPGPLGQVLTNLINNALVHAFSKDVPESAGKRRVRIVATQIDAAQFRLEIGDNGAGMEASALGRIFDPFYISKLGQGGSGLGLHIVHNIVADILAGNIAVESEPGRGTTFSITMPRNTPSQPVGPWAGAAA